MIFDYQRILTSGFLEKIRLANYIISSERYAMSPEDLAKFEKLQSDVGELLNIEEISKIREQYPNDRNRVPKQYEQNINDARRKHKEVVNPNIRKMKDEHTNEKDPVFSPAQYFDPELGDYISNKQIKKRTSLLLSKVRAYLDEITRQMRDPKNADDAELKNIHKYLSTAENEITRFMGSKFYTHRLTKSKDPMVMYRDKVRESPEDFSKNEPADKDNVNRYEEDTGFATDWKVLKEQTEQYDELLEVLEGSAEQFTTTYKNIIQQIKTTGHVIGYIWKDFPGAFQENVEMMKKFLSKPFGTIWYVNPAAASADMYDSDEEVVGTPKATAAIHSIPQLRKTAKDLLPENFKERQKSFQAQIDKGLGKDRLKDLTDLVNGDTEAWDKLKYYFKGWKPAHIAKLMKRLDWSSVADDEVINDIVSPALDTGKQKRDMYRNVDDSGSDFFDPSQLMVPEGQEHLLDDDYKKLMKEHENFSRSTKTIDEKVYSYLFSAKIPAASLDIQKMREQYEQKKSGIFNAIFVTPNSDVKLIGIMSVNLSDDEAEYQAKFNERVVKANQMGEVCVQAVTRFSEIREPKYAMPRLLGRDKEGNTMYESKDGNSYRCVDGKYYLLNDKYMPVSGKPPLTQSEMEAIDADVNQKVSSLRLLKKLAESLGPNPVQAAPATVSTPDSKVVKPIADQSGDKKMFVNQNKEVFVEQNGALHPVDSEGKVGPVDNDVEKVAVLKGILSKLAGQGDSNPSIPIPGEEHLSGEGFDEVPEDEQDKPEMDDMFISDSGPLGSKYSVSAEGKNLGEFNTEEEAVAAMQSWMTLNNYFPSIWYVDDHGGISPYTVTAKSIEAAVKSAAGLGGSTRGTDIGDGFEVLGFGRDVNGNKIVKFLPPGSDRAVSFQDNGTSHLHRLQNEDIKQGFPTEAAAELKEYYNKYMSKKRESAVKKAGFESEEAVAEELYLYIDNDRDIYHKYIESNIRIISDEIKYGTYTPEMAVELWKETANAGALAYAREFKSDAAEMFPEHIREMVAKALSEYYYNAVSNGEFSDYTDKY